MKPKTRTFTAVMAVAILFGSIGLVVVHAGEAEASTTTIILDDERVNKGDYTREITGLQGIMNSMYYSVTFTNPVGSTSDELSVVSDIANKKLIVSGHLNGGNYAITLQGPQLQGGLQCTWTWNTMVINTVVPDKNVTVGSSAFLNKIMPGKGIISGSIPGVTFTSVNYGGMDFICSTGTYTAPGTFEIISDAGWLVDYNVSVPAYTITFDSMGGSPVAPIQLNSGDPYGTLPVTTRPGYMFAGWYYTEADDSITGPVGSNWTAFKDLTMWAKWTPLPDIPYAEPTGAIATINWSWTPTTLSGAVVTVSGVDWLSVNGTNVYGVPPAPGEYTITVTITKDGYADRTETFVLTAVSKLVPTNSPAIGAIFWL